MWYCACFDRWGKESEPIVESSPWADAHCRSAAADEARAWNPADFKMRLAEARRQHDDHAMRRLLRSVAKSNHELVQQPRFAYDVCRTDLISSREAKQRVQGQGREPRFTISDMSTADALMHHATALKPYGRTVCALNFANGENPGGGYLNGARAQEEELCRQFPSLFTSLHRARAYGRVYPFGPPTYGGGRDPKKYADVLFTPKLVARRGSQVEGYRLLDVWECLDNMALVTAAAPNIPKGEIFDASLVQEAMRTLVIAPRLKDPSIDVLVLGAWGCGAFGCDPREMAALFAQVLIREGLGRLYKEVHFAIPGGNENARAFEETLHSCGVPLTRKRI